MTPSKWDDEEESVSPPPVVNRRKFDDEEDEEVLDSWDAAEDSEVEREKAAKAAEAKAKAEAEAAAKKKSKAQRIEEHKAERRKNAEADSEEDEDEDEDEAEKRARLRRTEKDSDLKHAEDLFGDIDLNRSRNRGAPKAIVISDSADPTQAVDLSAMPLFKPTTKDQFARLTTTLIPLLTAHSKKPHYALWAQEFTKQLVKELNSGDVKKIASALTTVSNEKMREERAADKGSKKSKAAKTKVSLVANRDNKIDATSYDDDGLEDDDFM
ncbi:eukaryotic translation initiation factor 3 subunit J [Aspergillus clavatus NRRL 1]|uniref:Eukaryotic translation initiation factor 3 subunit J n=1 Tax=Aspergillus clavatus (strain ATCC 1007 / CBS 513.65 / DSM 816 / NCTC 3887 / NRRL 1 / QM 1276 / 107) TaxID=344612 RepID=EIF3J_ASPCL|nr:eukaryotic translation initiation factor 3 subunit EifCj, putative [Aspergillus clavatus NRRL 1]A1CE66.1 RecName: Full=Eukaryotic translation initiation factor 3 subunit J; Short=eIF3j; AltName: Full=Eukaryotic translation initiation factor 3 30 kDa subunit homolog; Short=eIF-3 30 kDa subunit homolog [Aspergillus clavatus NRRL 1]EAW11165.1 eukaryotic translation initiation factor 3 subunit EifCj, putative [Aspergillus clavatus NRRL 1]